MAKRSRDKGKVGERELANLLVNELGGTVKRALGQERDGGSDLDCADYPLVDWAVQIKRVENLSLGRAWKQAVRDAGTRRPIVAHRSNGAPWTFYVALDLAEFCEFVRERESNRVLSGS